MRKKVGLFEAVLFVLIVLSLLPHTYYISNMEGFKSFADAVQIVCYCGLVYLICKKRLKLNQLIMIMIAGILLLIGYIESGQAAYFKGLLLIVAAKNIPYKKIIQTCKTATISTFCFTLLLWIMGISDSGIGRRGKIAIGYIHPNIAAQIVTIIVLLYLSEGNTKKKNYIWVEIIALLTFAITGSKTAVIVMVLAPFMIELFKHVLFHKNLISVVVEAFAEWSQALVIAFTYFSAMLLPYSAVLKKMDLLFTNRLFLNYYLFTEFGMKAFGQNVLQYFTGIAYNSIHDTGNAVITCDSTYALSMIVMGIIPTVLAALGYILAIRKGIRKKDYLLIAIAVLLTIYAFFECQMTEAYYFFIYFYLFSAAEDRETEKTKQFQLKQSKSIQITN